MRLNIAILLTLTLSAGLCRAQPLADRVPGDVVLYVGWHGVDGPIPGYEQSHLKAMVDASQISQLLHVCIPQMVQKLAASDAQAAEIANAGMDIESAFWKHPTAFYIEGMDAGAPIPKIAILCQAGADSADLTDKIGKLLKLAGGNKFVRCISTDDMVVISTFETSDHPANSLLKNKEFLADQALLGKDPFVAAYVDGPALNSMIDQVVQFIGNPQIAQTWPTVRTSLGLDGFKSLACTSGFQGRDWADQAFVDAPAPRQGLFNMGGEPVSDEMLKLIPVSATTAAAGSFDLGAVLPAIQGGSSADFSILRRSNESGNGRHQSDARPECSERSAGPLSASNGRSISILKPTAKVRWGAVVINRPSDAAKLSDSIVRIQRFITAAAAQPLRQNKMTLEFRQFDSAGVQIHYVATPFFSPSWAVKDEAMFIGLQPQTLAGALGRTPDGKSILDNPDYQLVQKRLAGPAKFDSFAFANLPQTIPQGYQGWVAASRLVLGAGDMFGLHSPPMLIPPMQKIMAETQASGSISWSDDSGFHMKSISSYPGSDLLGAGQAIDATSIGEMSLMTSILLPSLNRARTTANRVKSASNLRQIGLACMQYSNDHRGALPPDLGTLVKTEDIAASVFLNPDKPTSLPAGIDTMTPDAIAEWVSDSSDYIMAPGAKNGHNLDPGIVVAYEKVDPSAQGMNILFADYHVEFDMMDQAQTIIQAGKE